MLAALGTHIVQVRTHKAHSLGEYLGLGVLVGRGERSIALFTPLFPGEGDIGKERHCGPFLDILAGMDPVVDDYADNQHQRRHQKADEEGHDEHIVAGRIDRDPT